MADNVSDLISAGSLLVAIIALIVGILANRKANSTQQQLVDIEKQREKDRQHEKLSAQLRPELRRDGKSERLVIINQGEAEARNIKVTMDRKPLSEHCAVVSDDLLPTMVGAHNEISCLLAIAFGCVPPFEIEIVWDDDSGNDNEYRTTLTF